MAEIIRKTVNRFSIVRQFSVRVQERYGEKCMQQNKYLISETTKEERIALIKSWIPEDEVMDGCEIDLWEMYADYINGTKEIAECNAAFQAEYYAG